MIYRGVDIGIENLQNKAAGMGDEKGEAIMKGSQHGLANRCSIK